MRKGILLASVVIVAAIIAGVSLYSQQRTAKEQAMPGGVAFRILLGVTDREPAQWDGSLSVRPGNVVRIDGWRFKDGDSTDSKSSWKASTRPSTAPPGAKQARSGARERGHRDGNR